MCTVSFYKNKDQVIITSNRDEKSNRPLALPPTEIKLNHATLYCPIDPLHNGTWFAINQKGSVFVLLNGAKKKHIPHPPYKKSRGLILLEIADHLNIEEKWELINLDQIDNFTLVVYDSGKLMVLQWDGKIKTIDNLDANKPHIWSSVTLYDELTIQKRKLWFHDFITNKNKAITRNEFINFHTKTATNDLNNGLIINRGNEMLTKNVTQAMLEANRFTIEHLDLITNQKTTFEKQIS